MARELGAIRTAKGEDINLDPLAVSQEYDATQEGSGQEVVKPLNLDPHSKEMRATLLKLLEDDPVVGLKGSKPAGRAALAEAVMTDSKFELACAQLLQEQKTDRSWKADSAFEKLQLAAMEAVMDISKKQDLKQKAEQERKGKVAEAQKDEAKKDGLVGKLRGFIKGLK